MTSTIDWTATAAIIERMPRVARSLVAEHLPDTHGNCRVCSLPQSGTKVWPCTLRLLGARAVEMREATATRL